VNECGRQCQFTGTVSATGFSEKRKISFRWRITMPVVFDAFTVSAIIISICSIFVVLIVLDCCKIRDNVKQIFRSD
jgi:hypothetical protein